MDTDRTNPATPAGRSTLSPRKLAACRANARKAREANRRNFRMTPRRRAAALRNLVLAREALRRPSPALRAARSANLAKARAARTPETFRRIGLRALRHGLQAGSVRGTMRPLGEDPRQADRLEQWLKRLFAPADDAERRIISALAEALLRRRRLWRAEAHWQFWKLRRALANAAPLEFPNAEQTYARALTLLQVVGDQEQFLDWDRRLTSLIERVLRQLVRKRSGGRLDLKIFAREARRTKKNSKSFGKRKSPTALSTGSSKGGRRSKPCSSASGPKGEKGEARS